MYKSTSIVHCDEAILCVDALVQEKQNA